MSQTDGLVRELRFLAETLESDYGYRAGSQCRQAADILERRSALADRLDKATEIYSEEQFLELCREASKELRG